MTEAAHYPNRMADVKSAPAKSEPAKSKLEAALAAANMKERREPTFLKLDAEGQFFGGILTRIERVKIQGKPGTCYYAIDLETDETVKFNGTHNLDSKFRTSDIGHIFSMRYTGDQDTGQGQRMKLFEVKVSERTAPGWAEDGTQITDADLPPQISDDDIPY